MGDGRVVFESKACLSLGLGLATQIRKDYEVNYKDQLCIDQGRVGSYPLILIKSNQITVDYDLLTM